MKADGGKLSVIITGATGMVGEGVLLECLESPAIDRVLIVNRRPYGATHPKLKECIVPDFLNLERSAAQLTGYDACFYCAGVSSLGMSEAEYTRITYDITMHFAQTLVKLNPGMTFVFVSGAFTDSTEKGKTMWARVKGRTENALARLGFKNTYSFRPGFMKPMDGQRHLKWYFRVIGPPLSLVLRLLLPSRMSKLQDVGRAMIRCAAQGYPKTILEVKDINAFGAP